MEPEDSTTKPDGYVRPKDVQVRIASDAHDKLIKMSQRYHYTKKVAYNVIIDRGCDLNILSPGYTELYEALKKAGEIQLEKNRFEGLENACESMFFADGFYKCLHWIEGKPPRITKIASTLDEALDACACCEKSKTTKQERERLSKEIEKRWNQILLKDREGWSNEHTYCLRGGEYDEKKGKVECRIQKDYDGRFLWIDQEDCFTIDSGEICPSLKTLPARPTKKTGIKRKRRKR